jgi:hypothetical protein
MATTIVTKSGSGAPTASDLVAGELAVDLTNKRLYTEDSGGTVLEVGSNPYNFTANHDGSAKLATTATGIQVTGDIANASGNLTLDVAGDILIDTGANIQLRSSGTEFGRLFQSSADLYIYNPVSDKDVVIYGNDGGSAFEALRFDMSAAGAAIFNSVLMTGISTPVGIAGDPADANSAELGPGYLNLARDDTSAAAQILFSKNGTSVSSIQTSTNGLILQVTDGQGSVVVNDAGNANTDFRVESDSNANMLHVDGGNNGVGIGTTGTTTPLTVNGGTASAATIQLGNHGDNASIHAKYNLQFKADSTETISDRAIGFGIGAGASLGLTTSESIFNDLGADLDFRVESDNTSAALFVDGSNGKVVLGGTTANADLYITKITAGEVIRADNSQASWNGVMYYSVIFGTGNNNGSVSADRHFQGYAGGAARFVVCGNGDVKNTNNSYGAISDLKLKENIVDSGSQWDDIKALRIRKYSMKDEHSDVPTQIGVIAQELEAAGMGGLVTEGADLDVDNNDLGTTTKQVTYSVLYMKAVKALQEAMERIESLEARIAALES